VDSLVSRWVQEKEALVGHDLQKMTLDVLAACIFGMDFDTLNGKVSKPLSAYNYSIENVFHPIRLFFPWTTKLPLAKNKRLEDALDLFDKYCWEIMAEAKKKVENRDQNNAEPLSLMELMFAAGAPEKKYS
jgi:cytochrome P450